MALRYAVIAGAVALAALLFWHPARRPIVEQAAATSSPLESTVDPSATHSHRHAWRDAGSDDVVVYVAGAVKRPGLYHLRSGDRNDRAVSLAGGLGLGADAGAVNLAQRASDGDEIYVPAVGEATRYHSSSTTRRSRRHSAHAPPTGSIDVNRSDATTLAAVPGIGRSIAQRIVELRAREGSFASLDELLDVAGMTQTRLERARPYLRQP
ncbi:MAG TPA: helix-hairpin-helix domain-containing protein [Candidatus Cybelea sp.]|jgi:competence protein ComEA|nr:helix-hairpin-helix domain-containing protein [Candidatus Cybelea sp.]